MIQGFVWYLRRDLGEIEDMIEVGFMRGFQQDPRRDLDEISQTLGIEITAEIWTRFIVAIPLTWTLTFTPFG